MKRLVILIVLFLVMRSYLLYSQTPTSKINPTAEEKFARWMVTRSTAESRGTEQDAMALYFLCYAASDWFSLSDEEISTAHTNAFVYASSLLEHLEGRRSHSQATDKADMFACLALQQYALCYRINPQLRRRVYSEVAETCLKRNNGDSEILWMQALCLDRLQRRQVLREVFEDERSAFDAEQACLAELRRIRTAINGAKEPTSSLPEYRAMRFWFHCVFHEKVPAEYLEWFGRLRLRDLVSMGEARWAVVFLTGDVLLRYHALRGDSRVAGFYRSLVHDVYALSRNADGSARCGLAADPDADKLMTAGLDLVLWQLGAYPSGLGPGVFTNELELQLSDEIEEIDVEMSTNAVDR